MSITLALRLLTDLLSALLFLVFLFSFLYDRLSRIRGRNSFLGAIFFAFLRSLVDGECIVIDYYGVSPILSTVSEWVLRIIFYCELVFLVDSILCTVEIKKKIRRITVCAVGSISILVCAAEAVLDVCLKTGRLTAEEIASNGTASVAYRVLPFAATVLMIVLIFSFGRNRRKNILAAICVFLLLIGLGLSYIYPAIPFNRMGAFVGISFLYVNFYMELSTMYYVDKAQLQSKQTELVISQIKPHFLFNSIAAISEICRQDGDKAADALADFSKYLRGNLDSLNQKETIPFSKELKHIRAYTNIEEIRLGDRLKIEFSLECTNFCVPPISIQPLVENAIQYGVAETGKSGTVKLYTWEDDTNFYVRISDNGPGFVDTPSGIKGDGTSHIGLANVKYRLQHMVGGSLEINTIRNVGTTVTVVLPKKFNRRDTQQ